MFICTIFFDLMLNLQRIDFRREEMIEWDDNHKNSFSISLNWIWSGEKIYLEKKRIDEDDIRDDWSSPTWFSSYSIQRKHWFQSKENLRRNHSLEMSMLILEESDQMNLLERRMNKWILREDHSNVNGNIQWNEWNWFEWEREEELNEMLLEIFSFWSHLFLWKDFQRFDFNHRSIDDRISNENKSFIRSAFLREYFYRDFNEWFNHMRINHWLEIFIGNGIVNHVTKSFLHYRSEDN